MNNNSYKFLAKYYNQLMGDRSKEINIINGIIKYNYTNPKSILELGVGNGYVLSSVGSSIITKVGIDLSLEMINEGKSKYKNITFYKDDIRSFILKSKFDIIICVFDTINHIKGLDNWKKVIENAFSHLNDGGIFIFDVNTNERLSYLSSLEKYKIKNDSFTGNICIKNELNNQFYFEVKINDSKDGKKYISRVYEYTYKISEIKEILLGFTSFEVKEKEGRVYFVCKK